MFLDELPAVFEGLPGFRKERCESLPDVRHVVPHFQRYIYPGLLGLFGKPERVVQQDFRAANLDQHRRQPPEVGIVR